MSVGLLIALIYLGTVLASTLSWLAVDSYARKYTDNRFSRWWVG